MHHVRRCVPALLIVLAALIGASGPAVHATAEDAAEHSIRKFLALDDTQAAYRAVRRLEARNGSSTGWLEAVTQYAPETGFTYQVTSEGGSSFIRSRVLRAVLDEEQKAIKDGETARASIAHDNYTFQANGIDEDGLANILLTPRRQERVLVSGRMLLHPDDGRLVRLEGRLAKNPSFWVTNVDIVRWHERIEGAVVPIALESSARVRFLGAATLRMTYEYSHVNGQPVAPSSQPEEVAHQR